MNSNRMKENSRKGDWEGNRRGTNLNEIKELKQQNFRQANSTKILL